MPAASDTTVLHVVGDVHRHWRVADKAFLENGGQDLAVFVGDLGDEDVELVRSIAGLRVPKVVLLGNHDAWRSFAQRRVTPALADSLEALGTDHLGFAMRDLHEAEVTLIGARPFSWGGPDLRSSEVYEELYGLRTIDDCAERIVHLGEAARYDDLVIIAHNGPTGLGDATDAIYGKDFKDPGGDWGDADLEAAIEALHGTGRRVRAVIAGHMHHRVQVPRGAERQRFLRHDGVLHVNAAVVPRLRQLSGEEGGGKLGHFVRVELARGDVVGVTEIWVDDGGRVQHEEGVVVEDAPRVATS